MIKINASTLTEAMKTAALPDAGIAATSLRVPAAKPGVPTKPKLPKVLTPAKPPAPVKPTSSAIGGPTSEDLKKEADDDIRLQFIDKEGNVKAEASVEIADTPVKRRMGLSKRAFLPQGRGMFFDKAGAYWMKDVNFPLDILFLDKQGAVLERQHMPQVQEPDPLKPLYVSTSEKAAHALELPAGWCTKHGVQVGDTVRVAFSLT